MEINKTTFKALVKQISEIKEVKDIDAALDIIDRAYQAGRINYNDHELLFKLVENTAVFEEWRRL